MRHHHPHHIDERGFGRRGFHPGEEDNPGLGFGPAEEELSRRGDRHWRFGRGFGRPFDHGGLRLVILAMIAEKPRHGYELIKEIEQKFGGAYSPSPGSIYPTLTLLEEMDHIRASASDGARKLFEITDQGRAFLEENRATLDGVTARMGLAARHMSGRAWPESVHQAMHTLKHALLLRPGEWSDAEATRVQKIIEQAVDAISNGRPSEPAQESDK